MAGVASSMPSATCSPRSASNECGSEDGVAHVRTSKSRGTFSWRFLSHSGWLRVESSLNLVKPSNFSFEWLHAALSGYATLWSPAPTLSKCWLWLGDVSKAMSLHTALFTAKSLSSCRLLTSPNNRGPNTLKVLPRSKRALSELVQRWNP